jgi:hypothetical protein
MPDDFTADTKRALDLLGMALLQQLERPGDGDWSSVDFHARRGPAPPELVSASDETTEAYKMSLTVTVSGEERLRIPRPPAIAACRELDRVSTLGGRPRWRAVRLLLSRNSDGSPKYRCWWEYDQQADS